jgi:hypothetical protein
MKHFEALEKQMAQSFGCTVITNCMSGSKCKGKNWPESHKKLTVSD